VISVEIGSWIELLIDVCDEGRKEECLTKTIEGRFEASLNTRLP
jgi:hypothetical protein